VCASWPSSPPDTDVESSSAASSFGGVAVYPVSAITWIRSVGDTDGGNSICAFSVA
jgi:hypothetical protein